MDVRVGDVLPVVALSFAMPVLRLAGLSGTAGTILGDTREPLGAETARALPLDPASRRARRGPAPA